MEGEGEGNSREQQEGEGHRRGGGNTGGEAAEGDPFTLSSDPRYHEEAQTPPGRPQGIQCSCGLWQGHRDVERKGLTSGKSGDRTVSCPFRAPPECAFPSTHRKSSCRGCAALQTQAEAMLS